MAWIGSISSPHGTYYSSGYGDHRSQGFYGIHGKLNVWNPRVAHGNYTASIISLAGGGQGDTYFEITAGWMVNPRVFHDDRPRIFASYQTVANPAPRSGYTFDSECTGFIKTNQAIFTEPITQISTRDGAQHDVAVTILHDYNNDKWVLKINDENVGHWVSSEVWPFHGKASIAFWGGQAVRSTNSRGRIPIGSGHFPEGGFGKASYIRDVMFTEHGVLFENISDFCASTVSDYALHRVSDRMFINGSPYFFYGGPG